jgi:SEC-C motif-containing protein
MNAKPPSKNSRCPCGSGKKFRKCCRKKRPPRGVIEKARRHFREQEERRREFTERYGHARPPISVKMADKRLVFIGEAIYKQTRDGPYTFMHAIHDSALEFFGIAYMEVEQAKPFEQRHPAIQWMHAYVDLSQRLDQERNTDPRPA